MNDQSRNDLDQGREAVDALAQHVDTAAAWNAVEVAVERLPRRRARRRWQLAAAVIAVVVLVSGIAFASRSGDGTKKVVVTNPSTVGTLADCTLPALATPAPGAAQSGNSAPVLSGPAVASLKGGAALEPFALDGGKLSVSPPLPSDKPSVTATQAECAALASSSANGWSLLNLATSYGGAAVGYGRVSVDPALVAAAKKAPNLAGQTNQDTHPTLPNATPYQDRLAWIVVVREVEFFNGPLQTVPRNGTTPTTAPPSASNGYVVFLVDAQTGSDALLYAEAQSSPAAVTVPVERVSVPWTLVSRSPDGYSGTISATVSPCDGYPNPVNVDRDGAAAAVIVQRAVNASCGDPEQVTIPLHAATVTANLPAEIAHDALGPVVTNPSSSATKSPDETGGVLRQVSDADNGKTIEVSVGSVLAVGPLHVTPGQYAADMAQSSNTDVVGPLDGWSDYEVGEFRAWKPGTADLFVTGKCPSPGCKNPIWVVHVIVN
jgi:hypothetical protein